MVKKDRKQTEGKLKAKYVLKQGRSEKDTETRTEIIEMIFKTGKFGEGEVCLVNLEGNTDVTCSVVSRADNGKTNGENK